MCSGSCVGLQETAQLKDARKVDGSSRYKLSLDYEILEESVVYTLSATETFKEEQDYRTSYSLGKDKDGGLTGQDYKCFSFEDGDCEAKRPDVEKTFGFNGYIMNTALHNLLTYGLTTPFTVMDWLIRVPYLTAFGQEVGTRTVSKTESVENLSAELASTPAQINIGRKRINVFQSRFSIPVEDFKQAIEDDKLEYTLNFRNASVTTEPISDEILQSVPAWEESYQTLLEKREEEARREELARNPYRDQSTFCDIFREEYSGRTQCRQKCDRDARLSPGFNRMACYVHCNNCFEREDGTYDD